MSGYIKFFNASEKGCLICIWFKSTFDELGSPGIAEQEKIKRIDSHGHK
jgi:hypothetical protein